jgi:hypothetical protein
MEPDRRLNRWGLTFTPAVTNQLRKHAIFGQPQLSLEHQGKAKRYVVRGVESGGATKEMGYYVTFAGESGEPLGWLQTVDSLVVNGPHAIVISPALTRIEMFRIARTYELCITRHWPVTIKGRQRPILLAEELFRGEHGYLALELWGKDRDLSGCVRPQFFTRSGEEIEMRLEFEEAIKAATSGVNCVGCVHSHYLRLVALSLPLVGGAKDNDPVGNLSAGNGAGPVEHLARVGAGGIEVPHALPAGNGLVERTALDE